MKNNVTVVRASCTLGKDEPSTNPGEKIMSKLIVGLDETATGTQVSEGWCYFMLPATQYSKFVVDTQDLLAGVGMGYFHGKDFNVGQASAYEKFLRLIRFHAQAVPISLICCTLNNLTWKAQFLDFASSLTKNSFARAGAPDAGLVKVLCQLTPCIMTLMRLTHDFGETHEMVVYVDSDDVKKTYHTLRTEIQGYDFKADSLLVPFFEGYRKIVFPNAPVIAAGGIQIADDKQDVAIQAADVIGNFSTAYIYHKLGNSSKTRKAKATIFENVFGDLLTQFDPTQSVRLVGQNDLELINDGSMTVKIVST